MNVSIGIRGAARELQFELDLTEEELFAQVESAQSSHSVLTLTDAKGQRALIPADALGYVLIAPDEPRRVGFALS
jgi:hypothetical protein